jgi:hypothetical protein
MRQAIGALAALFVGAATGGDLVTSAHATGTGPQWLVGWGSGDVAASVQPGITFACDTAHSCEETVQGSGEVRFLTLLPPNAASFDFVAVVTADLPGAVPNGAGGTCHPVSGVLSLTGAAAGQGTLVLDIEGSDCTLGGSTMRRVITGTFVVDASASSGAAAGASGVGAFNWSADASGSPTVVTMSFSGCVSGVGDGPLHPAAAAILPAKSLC